MSDDGVGEVEQVEQVEIKAGSYVFNVRVAGPEDGRLVLLLHGFPQTSYSYRSQLTALAAAGYRAVAPDQRGYSPGARPDDVQAYALDHLGSDVLALADEFGAHKFDLVGHDWGAGVAWYVAGRRPDRLRSLTVLSVGHPTALGRAIRGELGGDQPQRSTYIGFFRTPGVAEDTLLANDAAVLRGMWSSLGEDAVREYVGLLGSRPALTAALNYYRANSLEDGLDVGSVDVPTLFVWSTEDVALGREGAEATAEYMTGPYRFEVVDGADHWLPESAASDVNRFLLEHLGST